MRILSLIITFLLLGTLSSQTAAYAATNVIASPDERDEMRQLATTDPLNIKARNEIVASAERALANNLIDPNIGSFQNGARSAIQMAWAYDNTKDVKYAEGATKAIVNATKSYTSLLTYPESERPGKELSWSYGVTYWTQVYSLIENYSGFDTTEKDQVKKYFKNIAYDFVNNTYLLTDNCITNMKFFRLSMVGGIGIILNDTNLRNAAFNTYKQYLDKATGHCWPAKPRVIDAQGFLGHEMARFEVSKDNTWYYAGFSMSGIMAVVEIARQQGINLWDYTTPDGRNFKLVMDNHVKYLVKNGTPWPHSGFKNAAEWPFIYEDYVGAYEVAQAYWGGTKYLPIFENKRDHMSDSLRPKATILTGPAVYMYHGRRIGGLVPLPQPSSPSTSPQPTNATGTQVQLTVLLHGIGKGGDNVNITSTGNMNPQRPQRTMAVEVFNASNQLITTKQAQVTFNSTSGTFTGTLVLGTITSGAYTMKMKTSQFLTKNVPGIVQLTNGQTIAIPQVALVNGDANGDNRLSILDYNILLDCFSDLTAARNCADTTKKLTADLTDDGNVNQFDYNLFLRELSVQSGE